MSSLTRTRTRALTTAAAVALAIPFVLSGCSFSTGPATISGADLSKQIADQFEQQRNVRPIVDCGSTPIQLVNGTVVHCDFSSTDDPDTLYDSTTTISGVNGGDFHIDTKVDSTPK